MKALQSNTTNRPISDPKKQTVTMEDSSDSQRRVFKVTRRKTDNKQQRRSSERMLPPFCKTPDALPPGCTLVRSAVFADTMGCDREMFFRSWPISKTAAFMLLLQFIVKQKLPDVLRKLSQTDHVIIMLLWPYCVSGN